MIEQFVFKNYKSYKDETTLSFVPADISEHREELIQQENGNQFLPVVVLYGPNGGGKSNVLEPILHLRKRIMRPVIFMRGRPKEENNEDMNAYPEHFFKFDNRSKSLPTTFALLFSKNGKSFYYELEEDSEGNILRESLKVDLSGKYDFHVLFQRHGKNIYISEELAVPEFGNINLNMPVLSYIGFTYDCKLITEVIGWFNNISVFNYNDPMREMVMRGFRDEKRKRMLIQSLNSMGIDIVDIRAEFTPQNTVKQVYTVRKIGNEYKELKIEEESSGTRKLFSFLPELMIALRKGSLVVADELDAKIHPKLLERIIKLFTDMDSNRHGAQLLMTSHDLVTMNLDIFRRDEIYFAALDDMFSSQLYSLVEFKDDLNKDIAQNYLSGKYGADPYFKKMVSLKDVVER